jgi:hypothetical protein
MFQLTKLQNKNLLLFLEQKLTYISKNNKFNGFIVFLFHLIFQIASFYFILMYPLSNTFYLVILVWIFILLSNYYFKGCILTKLERHLWSTKEWFGPYFIFCDLNTWSPNKIKNMYICQIILLITIVFMRILFKY